MHAITFTTPDGRIRGFNLDHVATFDYTPSRVIDDPESEFGKVGDEIPSRLNIEFAVPCYTVSGYRDGSSEGGTSLYSETLRDFAADVIFEALSGKSVSET